MNRIAVASLFDENYGDIAYLTAQNKFEYCARHDYSFHLVKHPVAPPPAHFSKAPLVAAVLRLHDWVMWVDTDALIMNFHKRIEDYIDERYSLVVGADWVGINTGVFFIKNSDWSFSFLEKTRGISRDGLNYFEQDQFVRTIRDDPEAGDQVKTILLQQSGGQGDFNCYPTEDRDYPRWETFQYFDHGDFIAHFPGSQLFGEEHRDFLYGLIRQYAREVIR